MFFLYYVPTGLCYGCISFSINIMSLRDNPETSGREKEKDQNVKIYPV